MFSWPPIRGPKPRKGIEIKVPRPITRTSHSGPFSHRRGCQNDSQSEFERRKWPRASRPPCMMQEFAESAAAHMTAATVLDVTSRLPGCAGQASDAVSGYTEVKMGDAPTLLGTLECQTIWIRPPRSRRPKSWDEIQEPVVPLERNWYGHPWTGLLRATTIWKVLDRNWLWKRPNWNVCSRSETRACLRHNIGMKEKQYETHVGRDNETNWSRRTNIFVWSRILGVYTARTQAEFQNCARKQWLARITCLSRYCQTRAWLGEVPRTNHCLVIWHGKRCEDICGKRLCELANMEIEQ